MFLIYLVFCHRFCVRQEDNLLTIENSFTCKKAYINIHLLDSSL